MAGERLPTFHPNPSTPKLRLPPGSWDTHCHVLGPTDKYPFASTTTITQGQLFVVDTARLTVNYKFGGAPLVAKY